MSSESPEACPDCASPLAVTSGFPVWCAGCGWAAGAAEAPPRKGFRQAFSQRAVEALYEEISRSEAHRPGWDLARILSYLVAWCVHAATLGLLVVAGVVVWWSPSIVSVPLALVLTLVAFYVAPRFGRFPKRASVRYREDAPALFALLDRVTAETGAKPVHAVVVSGAFNAAYGTVGPRRRPFVEIGLPLWDALPPQERIALLCHELAHGVNGDSRHGLVVDTVTVHAEPPPRGPSPRRAGRETELLAGPADPGGASGDQLRVSFSS